MQSHYKLHPITLERRNSNVDLSRRDNKAFELGRTTRLVGITTGLASKALYAHLRRGSSTLLLSGSKPEGRLYLGLELVEASGLLLSGGNPTITKHVLLSTDGATELVLYGHANLSSDKPVSAGSSMTLDGGAAVMLARFRTVGEMDDLTLSYFDSMVMEEVDIIEET